MQGSTTSRTHNGPRGGLTSVNLHLYNTSYLAEGFLARKSGDVDKGITKDAKIQQTPHTFSFSAIQGPRLMTCSSFFSFPQRDAFFLFFLLLSPDSSNEESGKGWADGSLLVLFVCLFFKPKVVGLIFPELSSFPLLPHKIVKLNSHQWDETLPSPTSASGIKDGCHRTDVLATLVWVEWFLQKEISVTSCSCFAGLFLCE